MKLVTGKNRQQKWINNKKIQKKRKKNQSNFEGWYEKYSILSLEHITKQKRMVKREEERDQMLFRNDSN